jgi:hypothetical protein
MRSRVPSGVRRVLAVLLMPVLVLTVVSIVPTTSASAAGNRDVLVLGTDEPFTDVPSKLQGTGLFSSVQTRNAETTTPSLADLSGYDAVLVYSDGGFLDATALGDVLADYVDAGGQVAVATFATNTVAQNGLDGRIATGGYLPFTPGDQVSGGPYQMVKDQPASPLLAGVGTFDGGAASWRSAITLANGASLIAHWNDTGSTPLVALKVAPSGAAVVGLNMWPPSSDEQSDLWVSSTNGARLMANALLPLPQQPDGLIRKLKSGFVGDNVYNTTADLQTVKSRAHRRDVRKFLVRVANDGNAGATFTLKATSSSRGVRVRYLAGGVDVTTAMTSAGGLSFTAAPGAFKEILVKMKVGRHARIGSRKFAMVHASWTGSPLVKQDAVKAVVRVR